MHRLFFHPCIVPLETAIRETFKTATKLGLLEDDRVLSVFVHPSDANNSDLIDNAKAEFRQAIERISD